MTKVNYTIRVIPTLTQALGFALLAFTGGYFGAQVHDAVKKEAEAKSKTKSFKDYVKENN